MKNTANTSSHNRRKVIQIAVTALAVACAGLSTRAAAVQIPETAPTWDELLRPAGALGQPVNGNGEAGSINAPLINVKGEASGINEALGKAAPPASAPPVQLRRVPLPGSAKASVGLFARPDVTSEAARPLEISVERNTYRLSFGPSQNCRRFATLCSLIGIP